MARGDTTPCLDDDIAARRLQVEIELHATQARGYELDLQFALTNVKGVGIEKGRDYLFGRHSKRTQHDRSRQLSPTVDPDIEIVLRIKLKIEPRSTVRNNARREQQLTGGMGFAVIVLEEYPRGTM